MTIVYLAVQLVAQPEASKLESSAKGRPYISVVLDLP